VCARFAQPLAKALHVSDAEAPSGEGIEVDATGDDIAPCIGVPDPVAALASAIAATSPRSWGSGVRSAVRDYSRPRPSTAIAGAFGAAPSTLAGGPPGTARKFEASITGTLSGRPGPCGRPATTTTVSGRGSRPPCAVEDSAVISGSSGVWDRPAIVVSAWITQLRVRVPPSSTVACCSSALST
jgi:hypothetical protein